MLKYTVIFLLVSSTLTSKPLKEVKEFLDARQNCAGYSKPGTITQCAGVQYITGQVFLNYLHVAESKIGPSVIAYSIGFTTGAAKEFS